MPGKWIRVIGAKKASRCLGGPLMHTRVIRKRSGGATIGTPGGLIRLGGVEQRMALVLGAFGFGHWKRILNKP